MSFLLWDSLLPGLQMFFIFCGSLCLQSCLSLPSETPGFHFSLKYKFVCLTTDAHLCIRLPPMSNLCFLLLRLMRGLLQAWIMTCLSPRGLINVFFSLYDGKDPMITDQISPGSSTTVHPFTPLIIVPTC